MTAYVLLAIGGWLMALGMALAFWRTGTQFLLVRGFLRDLAQRSGPVAAEAREVLASLDRRHR